LMSIYKNDPRIFTIADRIVLSKPQHMHLSGLRGSASQFVVAAVFNHPVTAQLNHLVILRDAEEAAYFHNTIENITRALDVFYFPSSFKNKKNYTLLNSSHVMLRTEALTKLSMGGNKKIIVTYPEAVFEKVVLSKTLTENIISLKQGETINVDKVLSRFVDHGFSHSDFVYEPGQFAVRGGILDIYSFGNEKPYRIELFGNDIDSIRIFDPETQLSERKLLQVNIIPNVETQFTSREKISLLNFLPENTVVWTEDWEFIKEIITQQEEDVQLAIGSRQWAVGSGQLAGGSWQEEEELNQKQDISEQDFVSASILEEQLKQRHIVEFGTKSYFTKNNQLKTTQPGTVNSQPDSNGVPTVTFNTTPQPAFNRQFKLLIDNLKNLDSKKYSLFIFADNPKQLERLHTIFRDLDAEINFTPIPVSIHEGFIDNDLKTVCYTDH
jgi:transcription-repair coupling factor (superfamily II helicase)